MKQFFKRISSLVLIGVLFVSTLLTACAKEDPFEWAKETPKTAKIGDELNFGDYITKEDDATYTLYVSYDSAEKEKQGALVYAFTQAADYTFEIERTKGEKKSSVSCEISVLPNAPEFGEAKAVTATIGDTLTFENLINASQMMVTPSDLQDKIEFTTVDITYATIATDVSEPVLTASEDLANKTSYTFAKDGVYNFNVKAVNKGGEDTATITVAAYDETKYAAKVVTSYAAVEKNLSWTAVTGATGYRVWIGNDQQDVTSTSVSMAGKADGEYQVKIVPVYTNVYYPSAIHEEKVYVGAVKTPLVLTREVNTVKWEARPFATSYTVTENGTETVKEGDYFEYGTAFIKRLEIDDGAWKKEENKDFFDEKQFLTGAAQINLFKTFQSFESTMPYTLVASEENKSKYSFIITPANYLDYDYLHGETK